MFINAPSSSVQNVFNLVNQQPTKVIAADFKYFMLLLMGFTELESDEHTCNKNTSSYPFFFLRHIFLVRFGKKTDTYRVSSFAVYTFPGSAPNSI